MSDALSGLMGAVIGSCITLIVTYMNNNKDYKIKTLEYNWKIRENDTNDKKQQKEKRLETYAKFLGSYRIVHGAFANIMQIIENKKEGWPSVISDIINSKIFEDAIQSLNEGMAWIQLLCKSEEVCNIINRLNIAHDSMANELFIARNSVKENRAIDIEQLRSSIKNIDSVLCELTKVLRKEIAI